MSGEIQGSSQHPFAGEPSDEELSEIESEVPEQTAAWDDPLEALFTEALVAKKPKPGRLRAPSHAEQLAAASAKMRALYSNPENWTRKRGVALVDLETGTLLGNFSEYSHNTDPHARKFLREHQPIAVEGTELINGFLGAELEAKVRNVSWDQKHLITVAVQLDELMVEAPEVELRVFTRFGGIVRADLTKETQFACPSGNVLFRLPPTTNIWEACSTDTKMRVRRGLPT